jgi:hypothetical protein
LPQRPATRIARQPQRRLLAKKCPLDPTAEALNSVPLRGLVARATLIYWRAHAAKLEHIRANLNSTLGFSALLSLAQPFQCPFLLSDRIDSPAARTHGVWGHVPEGSGVCEI